MLAVQLYHVCINADPCPGRVWFEGVCLTPVILATVREEGRLRAAGPNVTSAGSGGSGGSGDEFQIVQIRYKNRYFGISVRSGAMFFVLYIFRVVSHKALGFETILDGGHPEMISKPKVSRETSMKESKKHCVIFKLSSRLHETIV